jgi:hypothetical protein
MMRGVAVNLQPHDPGLVSAYLDALKGLTER